MKFFKKEQKFVDNINAYKAVFDSEDGKTVLYDLIRHNYVLSTAETPVEEGQRRVVIEILRKLNSNPKKLLEHIQQMRKNEESYEL